MRKPPPVAAYTSHEVMDLKKRTLLPVLLAMAVLILDSRCAADSARAALELCLQRLIPVLLPLFVFSAMAVPVLSGLRVPGLARLLRVSRGSEGIVLLGCIGGFPIGAACVAQAAGAGALKKAEAERMIGISSFCGPAFLFGIIGTVFSLREAGVLFLIQLETAVLTAMLWPGTSESTFSGDLMPPVSLSAAVKRAAVSMATVCSWVTLAGVAAGFLRRWLGPLLPRAAAVLLTGLLELTTGVFALEELAVPELRFVLCAVFVCFGGISVLLQICGLVAPCGLSVVPCIAQKAVQGILGGLLAAGTVLVGPGFLLSGLILPAAKIAVEISGTMVYNGRRKEGI